MKKLKTNPGVSLIIAIVFVSALLLVMAGLYEARLHVIQSLGNYAMEDKAEDLADSAVELASYWAANHKDGQNSEDPDPNKAKEQLLALLYEAAKDVGITDCEKNACAGFEVTGRSGDGKAFKKNYLGDGWYGSPVKATGNAAKKCAVEDEAKDPDGYIDDPCNWNKLYIGESADLPLYYINAANELKVLGGDFKLRMRAPLCVGIAAKKVDRSVYCDKKNDRVILYPQVVGVKSKGPFRNVDKDPVLVQWLINDVNGTSTLRAFDPLVQATKLRDVLPKDDKNSQNDEISGGRINDANPNPTNFDIQNGVDSFIVLERKYSGRNSKKQQQFIGGHPLDNPKDFLTSIKPTNGKPVLHLALVGQPRVDNDNDATNTLEDKDPNALNNNDLYVTYLEYQLLTKDVVADQKSSLVGFAEVGDFVKEFKKDLKRPTTPSGFALENL